MDTRLTYTSLKSTLLSVVINFLRKTIVKIFLSGEVNFDRFSLTGSALLRKRTYENIEGYKPVFINMAEFNSIPEHMNKINYLIAVGK